MLKSEFDNVKEVLHVTLRPKEDLLMNVSKVKK